MKIFKFLSGVLDRRPELAERCFEEFKREREQIEAANFERLQEKFWESGAHPHLFNLYGAVIDVEKEHQTLITAPVIFKMTEYLNQEAIEEDNGIELGTRDTMGRRLDKIFGKKEDSDNE